jgi:hypothetical protein
MAMKEREEGKKKKKKDLLLHHIMGCTCVVCFPALFARTQVMGEGI